MMPKLGTGCLEGPTINATNIQGPSCRLGVSLLEKEAFSLGMQAVRASKMRFLLPCTPAGRNSQSAANTRGDPSDHTAEYLMAL